VTYSLEIKKKLDKELEKISKMSGIFHQSQIGGVKRFDSGCTKFLSTKNHRAVCPTRESHRSLTGGSLGDKKRYEIVMKKTEEILENPGRYKNLRAPLNHLKEVHIDGHFVLVFSVDENTKTVSLRHLKHHTKIFMN